MRYKIMNLKKDLPTVNLALAMLEIEINMCKQEGVYCLKVIHGYGSHGVGGEIKRALNTWLMQKKKSGFIKDYVKGEQYNFSPISQQIKKSCPEVLGDAQLYHSNSGITLILL